MYPYPSMIGRFLSRLSFVILLLVSGGLTSSAFAQETESHEEGHKDDHSSSRFSDEPIPLADLPQRPKPIIELGEPFLGTGTLKQGIRLPTGAVWQPALLAFGTFRSALQSAQTDFGDLGKVELTEAAFRFDLFGNLYLTSSERILVGFRPFDQNGDFTRYTLNATEGLIGEDEEDFEGEFNFRLRTLFFEGDFGELFPALDWTDRKGLDIGISVGRQPLSFQDGMLINEDAIDAVGLTRANLKFRGLVNMRVTGLFAWGDINRPFGDFDSNFAGLNVGDKSAMLVGLFTETDTRKTTIEADAIAVFSDDLAGDGLYAGLGSTRRIGRFSNTWRTVGSFPIGEEGFHNSLGVLIANQFSWTPHHTHNHVYINAFVGIQEFRSAARGPANGGPLGNIGILYSAFGIGRFGAALGNFSDYSFGASTGYQIFFDHTRQQVIFEIGGRKRYNDEEGVLSTDGIAGAARYQIAIKRRGVIVADVFSVYDLDFEGTTIGGRLELVIKL